MKIRALITLSVNGKDHAPGTIVDVAEDEAKRLLARGFAVQGHDKATPTATATPGAPATPPAANASTAGNGDKPPPTIEDIVEAIAGLDPAKDYGKNGKPNVDAVEALLGADITAAQRDEAWEIYQKENEDDQGE
jgi:hypothetical protein